MKRITFLSLALIAGLCFQGPRVFAQDQGPGQGDAKDAGGSPKGAGAEVKKHVKRGTEKEATSHAGQVEGRMSDAPAANAFGSKNADTADENASGQYARQTDRQQSSRGQTPAFTVQGNQANHYNGQWVSSESHSDWDHQTDHRWQNHDYRWYDGGWLIIDVNPAPGYVETGSIGSNVQESLSQQGYYNGPIDGYIGRGTRRAIAHYERDNGLQVNGRIDGPLLASLRLQ